VTESQGSTEGGELEPGPTVSSQDYVDRRIDDLKELVLARFDALALALEVARTEINRRLEGMNELRDQIQSERGRYVTRELLDQRLAALERRVGRVEYGDSRRESPDDG
jgi:hypothetical protein